MKNKFWIILGLIAIISICVAIYFFSKNNNNNKNEYSSTRTSTNDQSNIENNFNNTSINSSEKDKDNDNDNENKTAPIEITQNPIENKPKTEEAISSFSTKIYTKENSRQNNISITCKSLNGTIVANGSTFSFCNTLGPATPNQGYQKADVFDEDGNKVKGLGGGKCQVSTTLYNAVLKTPGLVVTERHPHSNKVPYIQTGKDAAVSYGSYDLKFKNNLGYDIKIKAENTSDNITITLLKII